MDATKTHEQDRSSVAQGQPNRWWQKRWPAALGVLVAAATAYGLTDGRAVAPVVAASGLVYLASAATGRPRAAWVAFGVTIPLIALGKLIGSDVTPWLLALAAVVLIVGLAGRRARPWWALPLQTAAMLVLGAAALIALQLDANRGGLLVAAALLVHAAWDIHHHRTRRVVVRSLAEFCAVLDVLVAVIVVVIAFIS